MDTNETTAVVTDSATPRDPSADQNRTARRARILGAAKGMLFFLGMLILLRVFALQGFVIRSESMSDTLLPGEFIIVNRAAFGTFIPFLEFSTAGYSKPERFDVVVFRRSSQAGVSTSYAKRIVGMPGDTLMMREKTLYLNGAPVAEPYASVEDGSDAAGPEMAWQISHLTDTVDPTTYFPSRDNWGPLVVPDERFFVLGDNRDSSIDSRHYGFVRDHELVGRASLVSFSYDRGPDRSLPISRSIRWGRLGTNIH